MAASADRSVAVFGNDDLADVTLATSNGGRQLPQGLADAVSATSDKVSLVLTQHRMESLHDLGAAVDAALAAGTVNMALIGTEAGMAADVDRPIGEVVTDALTALEDASTKLIASGTHVLIVGVSTLLEPKAPIGSADPLAGVLHARNLAAVKAAASTGASVIDVDRLVAEIGGARGLTAPCTYLEKSCLAIRDEIIRVLDDYRLLDPEAVPVAQDA